MGQRRVEMARCPVTCVCVYVCEYVCEYVCVCVCVFRYQSERRSAAFIICFPLFNSFQVATVGKKKRKGEGRGRRRRGRSVCVCHLFHLCVCVCVMIIQRLMYQPRHNGTIRTARTAPIFHLKYFRSQLSFQLIPVQSNPPQSAPTRPIPPRTAPIDSSQQIDCNFDCNFETVSGLSD